MKVVVESDPDVAEDRRDEVLRVLLEYNVVKVMLAVPAAANLQSVIEEKRGSAVELLQGLMAEREAAAQGRAVTDRRMADGEIAAVANVLFVRAAEGVASLAGYRWRLEARDRVDTAALHAEVSALLARVTEMVG
jgi:hypothetical protein